MSGFPGALVFSSDVLTVSLRVSKVLLLNKIRIIYEQKNFSPLITVIIITNY